MNTDMKLIFDTRHQMGGTPYMASLLKAMVPLINALTHHVSGISRAWHIACCWMVHYDVYARIWTMTLDGAARRRGLAVLLADSFLMMGGFFMLIPLISVHYVEDLGFAAVAIGTVLAVRQLTQQGLTLFGGALADRIGAKALICWGLAIRTVSFAGLAWANTFGLLLLLCSMAALGGALFEAPRQAAVAALAEPAQRSRFYSLSGVAGSLGMTVGPLVGSLLVEVNFGLVCFVSALCFGVASLVSTIWLPSVRVATQSQSFGRGLGLVVHDRPFVTFTVLLCGFWFMWVQLSISLPLAAQRWEVPQLQTALGTLEINGVAWVYMLNAGLTVILQYPLLRFVERLLRPLPIIVLGVVLMATGLGMVALAQSLGMLLGCVVLFALGSMLVQPMQQTFMAALANPAALGSYFGFGALALAFGGGLGNYVGGWLYDTAARLQWAALPWLVFAAVGFGVAGGLLVFNHLYTRAREQRSSALQPAVKG
jgi:DHA1 family multidrug resistance protein-like MFS transporter